MRRCVPILSGFRGRLAPRPAQLQELKTQSSPVGSLELHPKFWTENTRAAQKSIVGNETARAYLPHHLGAIGRSIWRMELRVALDRELA